jgi:hypothetical protein
MLENKGLECGSFYQNAKHSKRLVNPWIFTPADILSCNCNKGEARKARRIEIRPNEAWTGLI